MEQLNYENDMDIDPSYLDICCIDQPQLVIKYARIAADAEMEMDSLKEKLDLVKAELDNEIRTDPEKFDISVKLTEAVVSNAILMNDRYKKAMSAYLQAKHEFKIVSGATKAVDHRKSMLENLVKLHGQQYFAGPNVPHDLALEWTRKKEQKSSNSMVATRMKRKER